MIELGLSRIGQLVKHSPLTWKAIHVAGTNGKGSITAYISGILTEAGVLTGRFNSPHLIDRWDCITIQDHPVSKSFFSQVEDEVNHRNEKLELRASEFEVLTATAFEIFNRAHVEVGVVEVGLGGRLDATNVLSPQDVLVSAISKIGLDHLSLLGPDLSAIAREKAGIMKANVPCVVDGTNETTVLEVLHKQAEIVKSRLSLATPGAASHVMTLLQPFIQRLNMVPHQQANLLVAVEALKAVESSLDLKSTIEDSLHVIPHIAWPGRLQTINLLPIIGRDAVALLDGAHNTQSAEVLSDYVDQRIRPHSRSVTWILAASKGKDVAELVRCILRPQDNVIATKFGPVDGMPWVGPVETAEIVQAAKQVSDRVTTTESETVKTALHYLSQSHEPGAIVIAGSLYLVSDVLRLLRASA